MEISVQEVVQEQIPWIEIPYEGLRRFRLSVGELAEVVEYVTNVPKDKMESQCRKHEYCVARQLLCYYGHRLYGHTLTSIGEFLGGRHHSSVICSIRSLKNLVETGDKTAIRYFEEVGRYLTQIDERIALQIIQ